MKNIYRSDPGYELKSKQQEERTPPALMETELKSWQQVRSGINELSRQAFQESEEDRIEDN